MTLSSNLEVLAIRNLHLHNFRNYTAFKLDFSPKPVIITGANGMGKTNILEAISLLAPGKGIRGAKLDEITHKTTSHWSIKFMIDSRYGVMEVVTGNGPGSEKSCKRHIEINNQPVRSQAELSKLFSIIWLTPQMDQIFIGSSAARRKLLDRLVYSFDAEHTTRIAEYENAMRQRAKLLQKPKRDNIWLAALEQNMAEHGAAIAAARIQVIEYLQAMIDASSSPFPKARLSIQGEIETKVTTMPSVQLEEYFKNRLLALRDTDFYSGRTNAGIHRSDLLVYHVIKNMEASRCSTGEQKALLLSIVLAEAKARIKWKSSVPVLLLDEVAAHLDEERLDSLFNELIDMKAQSWITGVDKSIFQSLGQNAQFFEL